MSLITVGYFFPMRKRSVNELRELKLYVWNADMSDKIPVSVVPASQSDIKATKNWQTSWTSSAANILSDFEEV